jgi:hypothetical protein
MSRVFDPPNQVWDVTSGSVKKVAECNIKYITSDKKMIEFFKPHDNGSPLVILTGFGLDGEFLAKEFPHARLVPLCCHPPSDAARPLTFEERILYSVNKK